MLPLTADLAWDERTLAGLNPAVPSPQVMARVGTESDGIELHQHPELLYWQRPELIPLIERFRTGARRDVSRAEYDLLSNFEVEAIAVMMRAFGEEQEREFERRRKGAEEA